MPLHSRAVPPEDLVTCSEPSFDAAALEKGYTVSSSALVSHSTSSSVAHAHAAKPIMVRSPAAGFTRETQRDSVLDKVLSSMRHVEQAVEDLSLQVQDMDKQVRRVAYLQEQQGNSGGGLYGISSNMNVPTQDRRRMRSFDTSKPERRRSAFGLSRQGSCSDGTPLNSHAANQAQTPAVLKSSAVRNHRGSLQVSLDANTGGSHPRYSLQPGMTPKEIHRNRVSAFVESCEVPETVLRPIDKLRRAIRRMRENKAAAVSPGSCLEVELGTPKSTVAGSPPLTPGVQTRLVKFASSGDNNGASLAAQAAAATPTISSPTQPHNDSSGSAAGDGGSDGGSCAATPPGEAARSPSPKAGPPQPRPPQFDDDDDDDARPPIPFLPDGIFRRTWDTVYVVLLLWEVGFWGIATFSRPYADDDVPIPSSPPLLVARALCSAFWIADLWVEPRTAKLVGWEIIESRQALWQHFLYKRLPFDGVISFPLDLIVTAAGHDDVGYYLMSIRVLRLYRVFDLFRHSTPTRETSKAIESFVFGFWCLVFIQFAACVWLNQANPDELALPMVTPAACNASDASTGGCAPVLAPISLYTIYVKCLYFIITTLSSVGYGDMTPSTNTMRIFNMAVQLLGLMMVMIISGRTGAYFITTDPYKLVMLDRKRRLEHLMANAQVPWNIQKEAFTIYPSLLDSGTKDYQSMLLELPDFIQTKISNHIRVKLIRAVPMFKGVSRRLLTHLADVLEEEFHGSKVYLIRAGEIGEEMYFLNHGIVEVLIPSAEDPLREVWVATLKKGSWFGEIALLKRTTRTASIRSVTSCVVFRLSRFEFENVLDHSEELRLRIQEETQRRMNENTNLQEKKNTGPQQPSPDSENLEASDGAATGSGELEPSGRFIASSVLAKWGVNADNPAVVVEDQPPPQEDAFGSGTEQTDDGADANADGGAAAAADEEQEAKESPAVVQDLVSEAEDADVGAEVKPRTEAPPDEVQGVASLRNKDDVALANKDEVCRDNLGESGGRGGDAGDSGTEEADDVSESGGDAVVKEETTNNIVESLLPEDDDTPPTNPLTLTHRVRASWDVMPPMTADDSAEIECIEDKSGDVGGKDDI